MCLLGGKNDFRGILVLVGGGGEGSSDNAISISRVAFRFLNVDFDIENDYFYTLNTNNTPAVKDENIITLIDKAINHIVN